MGKMIIAKNATKFLGGAAPPALPARTFARTQSGAQPRLPRGAATLLTGSLAMLSLWTALQTVLGRSVGSVRRGKVGKM